MKYSNILLNLGSFISALVVISASADCEVSNLGTVGTVKIGYIADLTGPGNFFSTYAIQGAQVTAASLSKSTGHNVTLVVEDIAGKFPNAVSAAQKLISVDNVDAIICDLTGPCSAIAGLVEESGKILIYNSPATSIAAKHTASFRNFIDYTVACRAMAEYWKAAGVKTIGSVNANMEFGQRCYEGIEQVFPKHPAHRYDPHADLRTAALTFKEQKVQKLIITGFEDDLVSWLKSAHAQGLKAETGLIEFLLTESLLTQIQGIPLKGISAGTDEVPDSFKRQINEKFKGEATNFPTAALASNAVKAVNDALTACPNRALDCLKEALKKPKSDYLIGFRGWAAGKPEYPIYLRKITNKSRSLIKKVES